MGRIARYSRRAFLIGSAAIAGGVAFGAWQVQRTPENPLARDLAGGAATFNPWVRIDADGITLITPHADVGQGTTAMQPLLIAEEMDLDPGQFRTDFGVPAQAYWNTALGAETAPVRSDDDSMTARTLRAAMTGVMKIVGMQGTGGSSSVPDSFTKLRVAGAVARETLKKAASLRSGVTVDKLSTRSGAVILPDGTALPYTSLAADAAGIEPVERVVLRDPSQWRLIGKPVRRPDIVAKSTGAPIYGIDQRPEGLAYAAVRLNPGIGAALLNYGASRAKEMRGVRAVLPITGGVAVVADNSWTAMQAVAAIDCEWAPAPYPAEQADHWAALSASFTDDRLDREWRADGDVDAVIADGTAIEAEYRAPYVAHQPMEPLNATVLVNDDGADIWTAHQFPPFVQKRVAAITGHDAEQVRFHNLMGGGSFGHRLEFVFVDTAAEIANQMRGTPVKLTLSREEDFATDFYRQIAMSRARGAIGGGHVTAMDIGIAMPSVNRSQMGRLGMPAPGPDPQIVAGVWNAPYALPDFRVRGYAVPGLAPVSSWRSVGASTGGFFLEVFLDELIHQAGADPVEERLRLAANPRARAVIDAVADMARWTGPKPAPGVGRGVAMVESFGVPTAEIVEVHDTPEGLRITRVWVAAEVGTVVDPVNFENQVQGGVVWGLGHAMNCQITFAGGAAQQTNYHAHAGIRLYQCPEIEVRAVELGGDVRGIGEPPVPPAAPALANAIFAATGKRLREMPFDKFVRFA